MEPGKQSPDELLEAANEWAAARAVLPERHKPDPLLRNLEGVVEELGQLLDGLLDDDGLFSFHRLCSRQASGTRWSAHVGCS
jgi:hypothetical protein